MRIGRGAALLVALVLVGSAHATGNYDLVIQGGRVIDPVSGLDAVRTIGIRDGAIVTVTTKTLEGDRVIDARGHVVAPGFVDLHSHAVDTKAGARMQVQDGATTQLELESGTLPVKAWYDRLVSEGRPANFGTAAAWTFARAAAVSGLKPYPSVRFFAEAQKTQSWMTDIATPDQVQTLSDMLEEGLRQGALAVGVNAGYAPGYATSEMLAVHEIAARYTGRPVVYHVRHMGRGRHTAALDSLLEGIALAQVTGTPIHFCHMHSVALQDVDEALRLITAARASGLVVSTEAYPYGTMATIIGAAFLRDPHFSAKLGFGPEAIVYLATGERPASIERLRELQTNDPGGLGLMTFLDPHDAGDAAMYRRVMTDPTVAIASDALPWQDGSMPLDDAWPMPPTAVSHPRSAGTFARFIREWVRDAGAVSLPEAIRRMSLLPAQVLEAGAPAMRRKGRLSPGADADIVVFDLETITDRATFERPNLASTGFSWVIVGGRPVVANGVFDPSIDAGRPVRAGHAS